MSDKPCPVAITGIEVHFCDEDGKPQSVFVNMNAVGALAWEKNIPGKPSDPGPCKLLPRGRLKKCDGGPNAASRHNLCWWDGNRWVCGEA